MTIEQCYCTTKSRIHFLAKMHTTLQILVCCRIAFCHLTSLHLAVFLCRDLMIFVRSEILTLLINITNQNTPDTRSMMQKAISFHILSRINPQYCKFFNFEIKIKSCSFFFFFLWPPFIPDAPSEWSFLKPPADWSCISVQRSPCSVHSFAFVC